MRAFAYFVAALLGLGVVESMANGEPLLRGQSRLSVQERRETLRIGARQHDVPGSGSVGVLAQPAHSASEARQPRAALQDLLGSL